MCNLCNNVPGAEKALRWSLINREFGFKEFLIVSLKRVGKLK